MIIRNTFLNSQMGQIVQYGNMNLKNRDKTLQWVDQKDKKKTEAAPADPEQPDQNALARIITFKDTINFDKKVVNHHQKVQKDVTSCLRGTKLNKYQKQRDSTKGTALSSSQGMGQASTTMAESSTNARKQSAKVTKDTNVEQSLDAKESSKQAKDKDKEKAQQLNFYQNSEGSSGDLAEKSADQDNNDSGEIIYQQSKSGPQEKEPEQQQLQQKRSGYTEQ